LFVGVKRAVNRERDLLFGSFALAYGCASLGARASFTAESAEAFSSAMRVTGVFASLGFSFLIWYVAAYTRFRPRRVLWIITAAFVVIGGVALVAPQLLIDVTDGVRSFELPWGETVLMAAEQTGPLVPLRVIAVVASLVYVVVATVRQFRGGQRRAATALAIALGWFILMIVEDLLVELGALHFVLLADFGFLGFVVLLTLQMVNTAIDTETELGEYRVNLEAMVDERSTQLMAAQEQLLAQATVQATTDERDRLARELHDVITQLLFSINLIAGSLPRLWRDKPGQAERSTAELQRFTRGALAEMRTLLRELRPNTISETDLGVLITHLSDGLSARHDIPATVTTNMAGTLPEEVHLAVYRIGQEAIANIGKHANASSFVVDLDGTPRRVQLSIVDDGRGLDASNTTEGGMGLDIMRERAVGIGASLTIASLPASGTAVTLSWAES
jgi:signal transduction histidine kinase